LCLLLPALPLSPALAQTPLSVTLQSNTFNGFHIKCFGKQTGSINATISGGTAPYQYSWTNGATTEDLAALSAGYYRLTVLDADSTVAVSDITLTEPTPLIVVAEPYTYSNGYNVSCTDCYNGSIDVTVGQGVPPYSYLWNDSTTTTQDRSGLDAKKHFVVVTDANNCWVKSENVILTQPERRVWDRAGNSGTDPATQYLGTADNKDVVIKSNGQERLRIKGTGELKLWGADTTQGLLVRDSLGIVRPTMNAALRELLIPVGNGPEPCTGGEGDGVPYWRVYGNDFEYLCDEDPLPWLGTASNHYLSVRTNGVERMRITANGKVGIGTASPTQQLDVATADMSGGINITNIRSDANAHTEIRFMKNGNQRWGLGCDFEKNGGQDFFLWDHQATAKRLAVDDDGRVLIGNAQPGNSALYKLYVEGGITCRDVKVTIDQFEDRVFESDYTLMSLDELRTYLARNNHLPNMPKGSEVEAAGGMEVGDLQLRLLRTVEEQALYILQLEERIKALEERKD